MNRAPDSDTGSHTTWRRDAFWRSFGYATLPLAIWTVHFFGAYFFVAIGCRAGLADKTFADIPLLTLGLAILTVAALAWLAVIIAKAAAGFRSSAGGVRSSPGVVGSSAGGRRASSGGAVVRFGIAILSFVAVAWTAPPIILFTSCLQ
jgi:hypothetical protein